MGIVSYNIVERSPNSNRCWYKIPYESLPDLKSLSRAKDKLRSLLSNEYYQRYIKEGYEYCIEKKLTTEKIEEFENGKRRTLVESWFYIPFNEPIPPLKKSTFKLNDGLSKI